ncbi:hypothetical protein [Shewanella aestuarii]|uniref:DUF2846 domain-containing protein n=1 Tax=Shewanella aestuarii TaxID=1028752 RepID=A0A6G9QH89_9GAMM|nr:hypothetical protein [Shewanella aestuarii]QIR13856.1 hypothetical protein HBH39_04535 [Shewanella aestuarii]
MAVRSSLTLISMTAASMLLSSCASSPDVIECGTVSAYIKPNPEQYLYRLVVTHLDGKPVISRPNYRLSPGQHEFTVVELINSPELKVSLAARTTKVLTVNVEANQRYHIAAQMNTDKIYTGRNQKFWQPVVFQQESYQCDMSPKS